jgi:hypothetical protein
MLDDLASYLQTQGVGTVGTDIFKSRQPKTPNACVTLYDTGGAEQDKDLPIEDATMQVLVRSTTFALGRAKVDAIQSALHRVTNTTIGNNYYYFILAISRGGHIGINETGLDEFSINFRIKIR